MFTTLIGSRILVIRRECGQTLGRVRVRTDIGQ